MFLQKPIANLYLIFCGSVYLVWQARVLLSEMFFQRKRKEHNKGMKSEILLPFPKKKQIVIKELGFSSSSFF